MLFIPGALAWPCGLRRAGIKAVMELRANSLGASGSVTLLRSMVIRVGYRLVTTREILSRSVFKRSTLRSRPRLRRGGRKRRKVAGPCAGRASIGASEVGANRDLENLKRASTL